MVKCVNYVFCSKDKFFFFPHRREHRLISPSVRPQLGWSVLLGSPDQEVLYPRSKETSIRKSHEGWMSLPESHAPSPNPRESAWYRVTGKPFGVMMLSFLWASLSLLSFSPYHRDFNLTPHSGGVKRVNGAGAKQIRILLGSSILCTTCVTIHSSILSLDWKTHPPPSSKDCG